MDTQDLHRVHNTVQGAEKRITNVILYHWKMARGMKNMPSQEDLDPTFLEPVLNNCFLIKATELKVSGKHNYVYIGKNILDAYGSHITAPKDYHDIDPLSHKDKFEEVLEHGKPVIDAGEFINKDGYLVKFRQCLVPLSFDGYTIDSIFGGMRFKTFGK